MKRIVKPLLLVLLLLAAAFWALYFYANQQAEKKLTEIVQNMPFGEQITWEQVRVNPLHLNQVTISKIAISGSPFIEELKVVQFVDEENEQRLHMDFTSLNDVHGSASAFIAVFWPEEVELPPTSAAINGAVAFDFEHGQDRADIAIDLQFIELVELALRFDFEGTRIFRPALSAFFDGTLDDEMTENVLMLVPDGVLLKQIEVSIRDRGLRPRFEPLIDVLDLEDGLSPEQLADKSYRVKRLLTKCLENTLATPVIHDECRALAEFIYGDRDHLKVRVDTTGPLPLREFSFGVSDEASKLLEISLD